MWWIFPRTILCDYTTLWPYFEGYYPTGGGIEAQGIIQDLKKGEGAPGNIHTRRRFPRWRRRWPSQQQVAAQADKRGCRGVCIGTVGRAQPLSIIALLDSIVSPSPVTAKAFIGSDGRKPLPCFQPHNGSRALEEMETTTLSIWVDPRMKLQFRVCACMLSRNSLMYVCMLSHS